MREPIDDTEQLNMQHTVPLSPQRPQENVPETFGMSRAADSNTCDGLLPWHVSEYHFPYHGETAEKLKYCLRYAILAPSSHNSQPWRFVIRGNQVALYADRTRRLTHVDPADRELIISCGAALANLTVALNHFGYQSETEYFPDSDDPECLAIVGLGSEHHLSCHDEILFQAIAKRRTNRNAYESTCISHFLVHDLQSICDKENVWFTETSDSEKKMAIANLVGEGDRRQMANAEFRAELAHWIRPAHAQNHDGIPCYAQHLPKILDFATPILARLIRTFDMGDFTAARDSDLAEASAVLAVISSRSDSREDWLRTGIALEQVLLTARAAGVWTSFLNQPIEMAELRPKLRDMMTCPGTPQILLRLGYGSDCQPTPRRAIDEVLAI